MGDVMDEIYVPWEDFEPILNRFSCPCCLGVKSMPDGEELEQRITEILDKTRDEIRDAIASMELKKMNEALEQTKAVTGE